MSLEFRGLAFDLLEMICSWEKKRREILAPKTGDAMDVVPSEDSAPVTPRPSPADSWEMTPRMIEQIISFLIRTIANDVTRPEGHDSSGDQAEALMHKVLDLWPEQPIKFEFFERLLRPDQTPQPAVPPQPGQPLQPDLTHQRITIGYRLINIALRHQFQTFAAAYASKFAMAIPSALKIKFDPIFNEILAITKHFVEKVPDVANPLASEFYSKVAEGTSPLPFFLSRVP